MIATFVFGVLVALGAVEIDRANRRMPLLRPASPEPDEHEACHGDPEWRRAIGEPGMIDHFHSGSISPKSEQDHA